MDVSQVDFIVLERFQIALTISIVRFDPQEVVGLSIIVCNRFLCSIWMALVLEHPLNTCARLLPSMLLQCECAFSYNSEPGINVMERSCAARELALRQPSQSQ